MTQKQTGGPAFPNPALADEAFLPSYDMTGMTLRAYAAIKLRVPESRTDWLDDMIYEAQRDYYAGQALVGLTSDTEWAANNPITASVTAYEIADAMIAARDAA